MSVLALKLLLAPSFVVAASLVARRHGPRIGGLVGGLPVVAGPILLVMAVVHGATFGSRAAAASTVGLVSLTAFVVVYAWVCRRVRWPVALPIGWLAFLAVTAVASPFTPSAGAALAAAFVAFLVALRISPHPRLPPAFAAPPPAWDLPVRAVCAAAMVAALTGVSAQLGAHLSGLLAPFPIITSVLAAFTQAQRGSDDAVRLLRGMLLGFFGFALFCFTAALGLRHVGVAAAFGIAAGVAVLTQAAILGGEAVGARP